MSFLSLRKISNPHYPHMLQEFLKVDILQCIAVGLILLLMLRIIIKSDKGFYLTILLLDIFVLSFSPYAWKTDFVTCADFAGTCSERENIEFAGAGGGANVFTSMLTATGVTVEAWINPRRFGTTQGITWKGGTYVLALNDSGQVYFWIMDSDNGNDIGDRGAAISDTVVFLGSRTHVMATHTFGEASQKIYINGVQQPVTVANDFSDVNNMANSAYWWFVGSNPWANGCGGAGSAQRRLLRWHGGRGEDLFREPGRPAFGRWMD